MRDAGQLRASQAHNIHASQVYVSCICIFIHKLYLNICIYKPAIYLRWIRAVERRHDKRGGGWVREAGARGLDAHQRAIVAVPLRLVLMAYSLYLHVYVYIYLYVDRY